MPNSALRAATTAARRVRQDEHALAPLAQPFQAVDRLGECPHAVVQDAPKIDDEAVIAFGDLGQAVENRNHGSPHRSARVRTALLPQRRDHLPQRGVFCHSAETDERAGDWRPVLEQIGVDGIAVGDTINRVNLLYFIDGDRIHRPDSQQ